MSYESTPANISAFDWQEMKRQQELNAGAISSLIRAVDMQRETFDRRLSTIEKQLTTLVETNHIIIDMLNARLPQQRTGPDEATDA